MVRTEKKKPGYHEQGYVYGVLPLALDHGAGYASHPQNSEAAQTPAPDEAPCAPVKLHAMRGYTTSSDSRDEQPTLKGIDRSTCGMGRITARARQAGPGVSGEIRTAAGAGWALREIGRKLRRLVCRARISLTECGVARYPFYGCSVSRALGQDGSVAGSFCAIGPTVRRKFGADQNILWLIVNHRNAKMQMKAHVPCPMEEHVEGSTNAAYMEGFESKDEIDAPSDISAASAGSGAMWTRQRRSYPPRKKRERETGLRTL
ncbi:hypothetical protein C8R44DRAFT_901547 [Mycena epipterygia]|nr:hypothetical protein C8R44DRAFT_901547 [Mycena epipterygia]